MSQGSHLDRLSRRGLLIGGTAGVAGVAAGTARSPESEVERSTGALPWQDGDGDAPTLAGRTGRSFLTAAERAFVAAAADRIIPPDSTGPSASEAGVVEFIDRRLAGAYGRGDHLYLGGPWFVGTPSQGLQIRQAPAGYFRTAIGEVEGWIGSRHGGKGLADLDAGAQDATLAALETGEAALPSVEAKQFFALLLENVRDGYFSDPIYGGNRGMAAWKMIGFPGARYDYSDWVSRHGEAVPLAPVGLAGRAAWDAG